MSGGNANDAPGLVEHRSAGVAGVDGRVDLDPQHSVAVDVDARHDAAGDRDLLPAAGEADARDVLVEAGEDGTEGQAGREGRRGCAGGVVFGAGSSTSVGLLKTLIRHPLDTLTVRVQTNDDGGEPSGGGGAKATLDLLLSLARDPLSLYAGVLPSGICSVLTGPVFFSCKDYAAQALRSVDAVPPTLVVPLAVLAATPVYWGTRTPLETIKARVQASSVDGEGEGGTLLDVPRTGLWDGYIPNCLYGYPADLIKFGLYDMLKPSLSPLLSGSLSTMVAQAITTPLDADRNRIMAGKGYEGGRWKGLWLRVAKGGVGGAVQFIVYEYVMANWS